MDNSSLVTVSTFVNLPIEIVWKLWVKPNHIKKWNNASPDWYTPFAKNDLKVGGKFLYRMEARDGSFGFDFEGIYEKIQTERQIHYVLLDGRKVIIDFEKEGSGVRVTETFEPEKEISTELQRDGWQAILDNFKRYAESL